MPDRKTTVQYMRADDFFKSAVPNTTAEEVRAEYVQESASKILDVDLLREQEAWSLLANKIVGAEGT